jgi:hypothetical protein
MAQVRGVRPAAGGPVLLAWTLTADEYEAWEERAAIMNVDGRVPSPLAEALALADVFRVAAREGDEDGQGS